MIVFVARYSVKNFFLAHYDLLQVTSILLHALGSDLGSSAAQLVFVPPDKANQGWWGPHKPLWAAFSTRAPLSYAEWAARVKEDVTAQARGQPGASAVAEAALQYRQAYAARATSSAHEAGGRRRSTLMGRDVLLPVTRAIFALSGQHSVYGRGSIGRGIERACKVCHDGQPRLARVSAFYRPFLGIALGAAGLLYLPAWPSAEAEAEAKPWLPGLWISRGVGLGKGYGHTVGRRCLNEPQVLAAIKASDLPITLTALELASMPFADQLPHFRRSGLFTGMHGAGYANIIFLSPGSVVAELCPLGYCTQSYERLTKSLGLTYMRWTNSFPENAKAGYDTVVDVGQFTGLMRKAYAAWLRRARAVADGVGTEVGTSRSPHSYSSE